MSNSPLATVTIYSPNCNKPRNHAIDTITIHHMACIMTVEACGNGFAKPSRQASSNYGIGSDGRIGLYVDEANRSWCSSSAENDNRAITIEVSNNVEGEEAIAAGWTVSDKALASVINLCADICKRNGKKKMIWCGTKALTETRTFAADEMRMTLHKWFAATGCPGAYLESKMSFIANEVTKRLSAPSNRVQATHSCYTYGSNSKGMPDVSGVYKTGSQWTIEKTVDYCGIKWGKIKGSTMWVRMSDVKYI